MHTFSQGKLASRAKKKAIVSNGPNVWRTYCALTAENNSHGSIRDEIDLKQQRQRRLRKRHSKSEFALLQTLSRLFQLVQFVKCWQIFWS